MPDGNLTKLSPPRVSLTRETMHIHSYMYMAVITGMFSCEFIEHICCQIKPSQTPLDTCSVLDPHGHIISLDLL